MSSRQPISIVNAFSTVIEKRAEKKLMNFLLSTDFFHGSQLGFLKGRSTGHAVLEAVNYASKAINNNEFWVGIFLDVKKAYDCNDHSVLLNKLENAGVWGVTLKWFKSFISSRRFKVLLDGFWSDGSIPLDITVLQGSILGAILFLVYINDLPNSTISKSILYADDS